MGWDGMRWDEIRWEREREEGWALCTAKAFFNIYFFIFQFYLHILLSRLMSAY